MLLLSLDTSAGASAALLDGTARSVSDGAVLAEWASEDTRHHAEQLAPAVAGLLDRLDSSGASPGARPRPDAVVVGTGPGPFTGLRAGIMTARTLAFAWDVPCWGVGSLHALARQAADAGASGHYLVATDARRRELYWAHAHAGAEGVEMIDGPHVGAPDTLPALPVYGAGAGLYPDRLAGTARHTELLPHATAVGAVALTALHRAGDPVAAGLTDTAPRYLRESDAKVPTARKPALGSGARA
ncbi:tRNA (adenosine(37)-N6)-threonylcarbamoyltransferase complex dimerization subunit type 1 TsaB [Tersicoccus phoenicis]|uniref:tRNA (Adenosine(37)-N6)-threonylcarbamoyltransferase complex dimerization subunit type 1 TsaB n=1 Tax=Tersicoccus phoenicis TaxID=554083 RepID=A0A1R1L6D8_9MICC|nr:tRNA (adenosine(37)-N6)-threonylcarbamoyltransferase complex dimerization subunit type 1 TsaB [Tersicoccus phoenicis]OMH23102.1 tRNA (adenosine(37)-N6)-threonylcarbamoyltransferase complex dimerization subunit type 1 TsaB [Tersicoccus phoenicis]